MKPVLVTCCNDKENGGIYVWYPNTSTLKRVYFVDCMGIALFNGYYIVASEATKKHPVNEMFEKRYGSKYAAHALVCLDKDFNLVSEIPVTGFEMGDLHDLLVAQNKLWVVDTLQNRIVAFSIKNEDFAFDNNVKGLGNLDFIEPVLEWRDPIALEPDASHVNGICFHNGRIWVSVFGRFLHNRGYEQRENDGCILDITNQLGAFGMPPAQESPVIIYKDLSDPHSLLWHGNDFYFIESKRQRIMKNGKDLFEVKEGGYIRGIAIDDDILFVGSSSSRHSNNSSNNCKIICISLNTGEKVTEVEIPAKEIYTFFLLNA